MFQSVDHAHQAIEYHCTVKICNPNKLFITQVHNWPVALVRGISSTPIHIGTDSHH